jgi:23S rRNA (adenine2030-N6)-methyltransferase
MAESSCESSTPSSNAATLLQYRHSKHAGNHGDVLKHMMLVQLLESSLSGSEALLVIDTHAGIGKYALTNEQLEWKEGILKVLLAQKDEDIPMAIGDYTALAQSDCLSFLDKHEQKNFQPFMYPGSPIIAHRLLQRRGGNHNEHHVFEWNPPQHELLEAAIASEERGTKILCHCSDGYKGCLKLLQQSNISNSGYVKVVVIDPPFKDISLECTLVSDTVEKILQVDSSSTIFVWIPMLDQENQTLAILEKKLMGIPTSWCCASLQVCKQGLRGSLVWIANPPSDLAGSQSVESSLQWLAQCLKQDCCDFQWQVSSEKP